MRVTLVSPCPYDPNYGGIQKCAQVAWQALTTSQQVEGTQHLCYGPDCAEKDSNPRSSHSRYCSRTKLGAAAGALLSPAFRADVIVFWHIGMLKLLPFLRCGRARIVVYLHGIECWKPFDGFTRRLLARVSMFLCGSEYSFGEFLRNNPAFKQVPKRIVALGLHEPEPLVTTPDSPPAALIIGRMIRSENYKGHRQLIEAWPLLLRHSADAKLWIVGAGNLQPELKALVPAQASEAVRFYGPVSDEAKSDLLRRCRCFVMPSKMEGFGLVYLEAMRLGRPCLVNSVGAGLEVVKPPEAGLAADPDNYEELARTLNRLLSAGPAWDQWSACARQRYNSEFTARGFQKRLVNVLQEVNSLSRS